MINMGVLDIDAAVQLIIDYVQLRPDDEVRKPYRGY